MQAELISRTSALVSLFSTSPILFPQSSHPQQVETQWSTIGQSIFYKYQVSVTFGSAWSSQNCSGEPCGTE